MRRLRFPRLLLWVVVVTSGACAVRRPPGAKPETAGPQSLQREIVARLAGHEEIRPGVKIANRTTPENKQPARAYLIEVLRNIGLQPQKQDYSTEGENIYAALTCGRSGAGTIVVGAHYDSARNSPGANDNATGVAAVASVAQQISRLGQRKKDFIFVFFDEEERGLRGSRAFAQMLKEQNRPVHSVHTIDQMGWDSNGNRAIELERPYEGAVAAYQKAVDALKVNIPILTTTEAGSDHSAFRSLGYPAVGITEEYRNKDTTPFIHRAGDTFETVNLDYLASTVRLLVEVMKELARN